MINYLKNSEIDKDSWDQCINNSINCLVYAERWFLDIVSPDWEALVEDDYNSVMPLPVKKKLMIPYLIQPRFTQQLGVFSKIGISNDKVDQFIKAIPRKFIWRDMNLNQLNFNPSIDKISERINYELPIDTDYHKIFKNYNENTRRNLVKTKNNGITIQKPINADNFLLRFSLNTKINQEGIALDQLRKIIEYSLRNNTGKIIIAFDSSDQVLAGAFFLVTLNRIIYLSSFSSKRGKELSAMFMIIDEMIHEYAGSSYMFDFEGSMIPGIAQFFAGFGAKKSTYYRYRSSIV